MTLKAVANIGGGSFNNITSVPAHSLLGNPTNATANASAITLGTNLSFSGSVLNATGGTPGGLSSTPQYNNSGSFGGMSGFKWDNITNRLGIGISPSQTLSIGGGATFGFQGGLGTFFLQGVSYNWPSGQGATGSFLENDGSGNLNWITASATAGGSPDEVQYNNAGALDGAAGVTYLAGGNQVLFVDASGTAGLRPLVANIPSGGTQHIQDWQYANGTVAYIDNNGSISLRGVPYSWPSSQGAASTFLQNDGTGILTWANVSASAAGTNGQVQFNNIGVLAGAPGLTAGAGSGTVLDIFGQNNNTPTVHIQGASAQNSPTIVLQVASSQSGDMINMLDASTNPVFRIDQFGNILRINQVVTNFPSSQGAASTFLENDGSGNLSWGIPTGYTLAIGNAVSSGSAKSVLFLDGSANLAQSSNFLFDPSSIGLVIKAIVNNSAIEGDSSDTAVTGQLGYYNSGTGVHYGVAGTQMSGKNGYLSTQNIGTGSITAGGYFTNGTQDVALGDTNYAINVLNGHANVPGTSNNTFRWNANTSAPTPQTLLALPVSVFGQGTINQILGTPDNWLLVNVNGTDYKIPAYL